MSESLELLKPYRTNHLILLVGGNPLPNWVAARLLLKRVEDAVGKPRRIWLLHSDGSGDEPSTLEVAGRLKKLLWQQLFPGVDESQVLDTPENPIVLVGISSSDDHEIQKRLQELAPKLLKAGSIGLNYTGGAKPMSVHVYRFLETLQKRSVPIRFSYLDPRHMSLRIEDAVDSGQREFHLLQDDELREMVSISQVDLAALHGYEPPIKRQKVEWRTGQEDEKIYHLAWAIGRLYVTKGLQIKQWYAWLDSCPKFLPERSEYAALGEVIQAMDELAGSQALTPEEKASAVVTALKPGATKGLVSCHKWFTGAWLEEYAQGALIEAVKRNQAIHEGGRNLKYIACDSVSKDDFELDAAAIYGYQLFAISCTTAGGWVWKENEENILTEPSRKKLEKKETAKEHLMEIYVRARQLGGDEARIGLVCFYDNPEYLEDEIRRSWDVQGKIKVFRREEFYNLAQAFRQWFASANI